MDTTNRKLTLTDNLLVLVSLVALLGLLVGPWPTVGALAQLGFAVAIEEGLHSWVTVLYRVQSVGIYIYGYGLAIAATALSVLALFSGRVRQLLPPVLWLVFGVLGLVLPTIQWILVSRFSEGSVGITVWGWWLWAASFVIMIVLSANKISAARGTSPDSPGAQEREGSAVIESAGEKGGRGCLVALILVITAITATILLVRPGVFTIQPIGAVPDGVTFIYHSRNPEMSFFSSPDSLCLKTQGSVSLLCRGTALAAANDLTDRIIIKLPYIHWAYLQSTGGREFER